MDSCLPARDNSPKQWGEDLSKREFFAVPAALQLRHGERVRHTRSGSPGPELTCPPEPRSSNYFACSARSGCDPQRVLCKKGSCWQQRRKARADLMLVRWIGRSAHSMRLPNNGSAATIFLMLKGLFILAAVRRRRTSRLVAKGNAQSAGIRWRKMPRNVNTPLHKARIAPVRPDLPRLMPRPACV